MIHFLNSGGSKSRKNNPGLLLQNTQWKHIIIHYSLQGPFEAVGSCEEMHVPYFSKKSFKRCSSQKIGLNIS